MDLGQKAKQILADYVPVIDKKLSVYFDNEIKIGFGFNKRQQEIVKELLLHAKEHNLRASKRLRGSLVNYGYLLSKQKINNDVWNAAIGVELVHTALLIHDDFMDRDLVRRGGPTTHKFYEEKYGLGEHFGASMAINAGDAVLCLGFELLLSCDNTMVMQKMLRGITNTAYGQAYDVVLEAFKDWSENDVITLHTAKTAIYTYQNPLFIGAYLGGIEDKSVLDILTKYSFDAGVAFQLQDDILGVFGTPEKTGKSADSDLLQGKCTLLVLKVFQEGKDKQKQAIERVWGKLEASNSDLDEAKKAIMECGSYEYSKQLAKNFAGKAAKNVATLRKNSSLNTSAIDYIQGIAEYMVVREV